MLAKLKWVGADFGRWRLEGRTVVHKAWSGVVWRRKASAMAYTAACRFKPLPVVTVFWEVAVDGFEPAPFQAVIVFSVRRFDEVRGVFTHRVEKFYDGVEIPMLTLDILSLTFDGDRLSKTYRIRFGPLTEPIIDETFTLSVPPFNGGELAVPNLDHEQMTFG